MKSYQGKGVYGAIAIGKISLFKKPEATVKRVRIDDTDGEKSHFEQAKAKSLSQLQEIYDKALKEVGEANAAIFEIHQMMLDDEDYNDSINNIIKTQSVNAEYAVAVTADNFAEMFSSMDDAYMKARAVDVRDISNRIISNLTGKTSKGNFSNEKVIICASDLASSETVSLDKDRVLAFADPSRHFQNSASGIVQSFCLRQFGNNVPHDNKCFGGRKNSRNLQCRKG